MKLLFGFVFLCFRRCLSEDVYDITAIYHVARNSGPEDLEFHLDSDTLDMWEYEHWDIVTADKSPFVDAYPRVLHYDQGVTESHLFYEYVQINVNHGFCNKFGFILTPDEKPLELQPLFYYILSNEASCPLLDVYKCNDVDNDTYVYIGEETFYCVQTHSFREDTYNEYSLYIKQENDAFKFWADNINTEPRASWYSQIPMKFFKMFSNTTVHAEVITIGSHFETSFEEAKLISQSFIPKYKNMCLTVVFHSEKSTTIKNLMNVYVQDLQLSKFFVGSIEGDDGFKVGRHKRTLTTLWPDCVNSTEVRLIIETCDIDTKIRLERISSCNGEDGEDIILLPKEEEDFPSFSSIGMPLLKNQGADSIGPADETERCWYNSVHVANGCACPAGFVGAKCEEGCGENRFGKDCNGKCSTHSTKCSGLLLCTPVAGCFCAPGYRGDTCQEQCENGTYGNNCTQSCGHCEEGTCDIYTGKCSACLPGYQLPLCQEKYDYTLFAPKIEITVSSGEITVIPVLNYTTHNANPLFYSIQHKKDYDSEPWLSHRMYPIPIEGIPAEIVIGGLELDTPYKVRTVLIDKDFNSYQGEDIPTANFTPLCFFPENPEYNLKAVTIQTSFTVSWMYVLKNVNWCPVENFEVSWKDGWNWISDFTDKTDYTVSNLLPDTAFKFKVRALAINRSAPFSPIIEFSTKPSDFSGPVRNLKVVTTDSNSQEISWNPPLGLDAAHLTYIMKYKCLTRVACQKDCAESSGELQVINSSRILMESIGEILHPFSQYLVTVSAENGASNSIVLGTNMTAPVETPQPSLKPPVTTNTTVTIYWDKPEVCSALFNNSVYKLYKEEDSQPLKTGSTLNSSMTFDDLQASIEYRVLIYIQTSFGDINHDNYLEINVSTLARDTSEEH